MYMLPNDQINFRLNAQCLLAGRDICLCTIGLSISLWNYTPKTTTMEFANSRVDDAHVQHKEKRKDLWKKGHIIITMNESLKCAMLYI